LIYGASLTLSLDQIKMHIIELNTQPFFWIGILLFVIGFTFKIAAVPFHSWAPDVYQGAPTVVTAVMSSASKAAAFAALVIVLAPLNVYPASQKILVPFLSVIAVLSMIYGSIAALTQEDIKRLLAYSSIAHAGYILIGVASASSFGQGSVVFYLIVYTLMNLGAFGIISILENREGRYLLITDYEGFAVKSPVLAALLAIFMFSLSGLPPFAGFSAKYFVFMAAVKANLTWLAILGAIASAISVYFYLRVITVMYFKTGVKEHQFVFSKPAFLGIMITLVLFLAISIYPSSIFNALFTN
jgi:NADH-quinone oxidoreductase subunit N